MPDWEAQRVRFAWERTEGVSRDYTNYAKAAPALVMNCGLMQTLAFLQSRSDDHRRLAGHICCWLEHRFRSGPDGPTGSAYKDVMDWLARTSPARYRLATREVMSLLQWIKQFAESRQAK